MTTGRVCFYKFLSALTVASVFALAGTTLAQKPKTKSGTTSAVVSFRDSNADSADRVRSDGGGPYIDNVQKVSAYIQSGAHAADIELWLGNTKGVRTLSLDFSDCVSADGCSSPFQQGFVYRNTAWRTLQGNLPAMEVGETNVPVRLRIEFDAPDPATGESKHWFLRFDPLDFDTECQGSNLAISRISSSAWVIEAGSLQTACLLSQEGVNQPRLVRGRFAMPFQATVTLK